MSEHSTINLNRAGPTWHSPAVSAIGRKRGRNGLIALLLEDEPLISIDVEMTLGDAGFDVFYVMSCREAHAWLDLNVPNVVIVDIELSDGPCTAVVEQLIHSKIPFIIHSGYHSSVHVGTPVALAAWVNKPALPDDLIKAAHAAAVGLFHAETAA